ncbi:hypothetical protein [Marinobacter sp. SS21]|nr:hypothetical protein [Marinobacter sp. SS21]MDC0661348.1 hypothetical protein [Marinobacter sp. SS21]
MLYQLASPLFTLAALLVIGGVAYSAKAFFDHKLSKLDSTGDRQARA